MKTAQIKHNLRRAVCCLLAFCCMTTAAFAAELPFTDVQKGSYYYDAVDWAYQNNITVGTSATEFSPDMGCSRGQVVTFLWNSARCPAPMTKTEPFEDVNPGDYYYNAVLWAVENDITKGTSDTKFSPLDNCTYEQILAFIHRAQGEPAAKTGVKTIADNYPNSAWYKTTIQWADSYDLLDQTKGFKVGKTCPRSDIVQYLYVYSQTDPTAPVEPIAKVGTVDVRVNDTLYADQAKKEGNDFYVSTDFVKSALGVNMTSSRADKLVKATDAAKAAGAMYEYSDAYDTIHFLKSTAFTQGQAEYLRNIEMKSWINIGKWGVGLKEDLSKGSSIIFGNKEERLAALTSKANSYELMNTYGITGAKAVSLAKAAVETECSDYKLEFVTDETMTWHSDGTKGVVCVRGYLKMTPYNRYVDWSREVATQFVGRFGSNLFNASHVSYIPYDVFVSSGGLFMSATSLGATVCPDIGKPFPSV